MQDYKIIALSESALLIQFSNTISLNIHKQVIWAKNVIETNPFSGFIETVPAYSSLAVYYNPLQIRKTKPSAAASIERVVREILSKSNEDIQSSGNAATISIPVCYDEVFGIDLAKLSETLELSIHEIIQLHSSHSYKVFMTGFTPGFPYMGILNERITTKRKTSPRLKVEAGAVAIAGNQTGIYPFNTPGGWNIIGKTPLNIFDKQKANPFLLQAGDEVMFIPITRKEFDNWETN